MCIRDRNTLLYQLWRESRDKNIALSHLSQENKEVGNPVGIVGVVLFIAGQNNLQIPAIMDIQGEVQQLFLPANPPELETQIVPISPSGCLLYTSRCV